MRRGNLVKRVTTSLIAAAMLVTMLPANTVKAEDSSEMTIAINVLYNDSDCSYFGTEKGQEVTITGDGSYTIKFDCATDLSEDATKLGVTGLNNLTAIYLKDIKSSLTLETADIMWDKVVVDGKELTITQTEPKSALKDSGIFDTNDPLNSWDGSSVEEIECDTANHVLNFKDLENPQTIEITFTLSNVKFKDAGAADETATTAQADKDSDSADDSDDNNFSTYIYIIAAVVVVVIAAGVVVGVKKKKSK